MDPQIRPQSVQGSRLVIFLSNCNSLLQSDVPVTTMSRIQQHEDFATGINLKVTLSTYFPVNDRWHPSKQLNFLYQAFQSSRLFCCFVLFCHCRVTWYEKVNHCHLKIIAKTPTLIWSSCRWPERNPAVILARRLTSQCGMCRSSIKLIRPRCNWSRWEVELQLKSQWRVGFQWSQEANVGSYFRFVISKMCFNLP